MDDGDVGDGCQSTYDKEDGNRTLTGRPGCLALRLRSRRKGMTTATTRPKTAWREPLANTPAMQTYLARALERWAWRQAGAN